MNTFFKPIYGLRYGAYTFFKVLSYVINETTKVR